MKAVQLLRKVEFAFLAICMLAATGLLFANVALRYFFESAIFWAEEALRYIIIWITFLGAAACIREHTHISLDTLAAALPAPARRVAALAAGIIQIAASLGLALLSLDFTLKTMAGGQVSSTLWGLPMAAIYACLPIGLLLSAIWATADFIKVLRTGRGEA
jgi:C4-dicarboxylate transporter DctQ subunit